MIDDALEAAADEVEAGRLPEALAGLLEAWREVPATTLALAIDHVSKRIVGDSATPKRRWRAMAKRRRPEDLGRLLASWRDVPGAEVAVRAELLRAWPADPRRDAVVAAALHEAPYRTTPKFWTQLCELARTIRDPGQVDRLRDVSVAYRRFGAPSAQRLAERVFVIINPLIESLEDLVIPPTGERGKAALARLTPPPPAPLRSRADDLRARVFEQPMDYGLRAIYADALIEAGDPLGELIVLGLTAREHPPSADQRARQAALTKQLTKQMLGPLDKVVFRSELAFDCGFVSRCTINSDAPQLSDLVRNPWWSTIVELYGPASVFLDPGLRSLRRLRTQTDGDLELLVASKDRPALEALRCDVGPRMIEVLRRAELPALRHFRADSCSSESRELLDLPLVADLESLHIDLPWLWRPWLDALLDRPCPVPELVLLVREGFERMEMRVRGTAVELALAPPPNKFAAARHVEAALTIARALPARVTKLAITSRRLPPELAKRVAAVVR
ncbi:MAG: hypothetical protein ABI867_30505 [Kofleriaceae bacterium]